MIESYYDLEIKFSLENPRVKLPTKKPGDAGYDLYVDMEWFKIEYGSQVILEAEEFIMLSTGLRSVFSEEWFCKIEERSSSGYISLKKNAGVIDSNSRGIWQLFAINASKKKLVLCDNETYLRKTIELLDNNPEHTILFNVEEKALFQFLIHKVPRAIITEVGINEIMKMKSDRGVGMIGSSGK